jgi:hypothetical protein
VEETSSISWPDLQELETAGDEQGNITVECMPAWAKALFNLGYLAETSMRRGAAMRLVVVIPDREYASLFVALGGLYASLRAEQAPAVKAGDRVVWMDDASIRKKKDAQEYRRQRMLKMGLDEPNVRRIKLPSGIISGETYEFGPSPMMKIPSIKGNDIEYRRPEDLVVTNGNIFLDSFSEAKKSLGVWSLLGLDLGMTDLLAGSGRILIAGVRNQIIRQSFQLGLRGAASFSPFNDLLCMQDFNGSSFLTAVASAYELNSRSLEDVSGLIILDGQQASHLLQNDPDNPERGVFRRNCSNVLLLDEFEYSRSHDAISGSFDDWNGRWLGADAVGHLFGGVKGAFIMGQYGSGVRT